jgi:acetate kinase
VSAAPAEPGANAGSSLVLVLNAGSTGLKASLHGPGGACLWRGQRRWQELAIDQGQGPAPAAGPGSGPQASPAPAERSPAADPAGLAVDLAPGTPAGEALAAWLEQSLAGLARLTGPAVPAGLAGLTGAAEAPPRPAMVAHRVVHGGERFTAPTPLDPTVLEALEALTPLAPLHNGPALALVRWAGRRWPDLPHWACFDTAFHADLPPEARTYAIPAAWRQQGLRRYGFHGLNHQHVAEVVLERCGRLGRAGALRLISCHLGGGCSLCAIRDGRSLATTMGFTPLEGLVMASRSGSVDPGLLLHQLRRGLGLEELERALQRQGGLLGLSELSASMEVLRAAAAPPPQGQGHPGASLAIAVFRRRLLEGIGAMAACLEGVDVIALSGGIGEHDQALRAELQASLGWLGPLELLVVPADEEGVIARSCLAAAAI